MPWRTAGSGRLILIALSVLIAVGGAVALGYEFYAPVRGQVAVGNPQEAQPDEPRDRAKVKVEAYMAKEPGKGLPTLADVVRFYGLEEDTVPCAVAENHGEAASKAAIPVLAKRPIRVGEEVTLCLD
ncbi:MAG: hypothetical protein ABUT39_30040 [Acidobacteriota bacterium]